MNIQNLMKFIKRIFCKHKKSRIVFGYWSHYVECENCGKRKELH